MIDRRVQKTLQALHEALISLILEKGYDATSVKDIIQRANVSRSTFYTHYVDKEHLLQGGLDNLGKFLLAQQRNASKRPMQPNIWHSVMRFLNTHKVTKRCTGQCLANTPALSLPNGCAMY